MLPSFFDFLREVLDVRAAMYLVTLLYVLQVKHHLVFVAHVFEPELYTRAVLC